MCNRLDKSAKTNVHNRTFLIALLLINDRADWGMTMLSMYYTATAAISVQDMHSGKT